ncbi:ammonium transporter [Agrobacterium radiobacter]|jgi:Amt family ammonium transporter|uniref:Ammonium transporter n=3 Tax=Agrobacterium tumefaciens complex TaxID=1183400 RepID=A0AAP4YT44_AGRTU|nr:MULTISPECIES: ammonium transporter [Agrobacterium]MCP2133460.1 Amt family ammonium transporter [Rhizobium sp. SLBN-94]TGE77857.1 ammonium transporter [Rhizobium sp. SEMIA 439]AYM06654.1 ammonium transporter [Agrobacterium tumefaciens]EPR20542.1 ammonia channel protein [Agrobacterium radiobacter DSM 30147]KAA1235547.1 ammonium transporter [Agrobacterium tumefaciens]
MQLNKFSTLGKLGAAAAALMAPAIAFAQDAAPAAAAAPVPEKADTAFMYVATILVLFMILPGLALFYGGLVRTKNMLSVLMQCTVITAVMMLIWVIYGYSFAFGGGTGPYFGGFGKLFLSGVSLDSTSATFSQGVVIYEYTFIAFQMTFAAITPALIIGAFAERVKFSAVILFTILWATFVYFPIAHMVWDANGLIFGMGALDFAGGTVVHINAGVAGLIGAIMVGKRTGFGKDMMAPHSMTLTLVGAAMLWFGWFGFNAGSNLEASGGAVLATMNTFLATAAAIVSWSLVESFTRGKASMLGAASGMIAGLVAVTPAAGSVGPMGAIVLGLIVSPICYFFVSVVKNKFGYDDTADVFGVHGIGGIIGALGTGIFTSPLLGGTGKADFSIASQVWTQFVAVAITIVWCAIVSAILYKIVDVIVGLRVPVEAEREGLDLATHGEAAYHS